MLLIAGDQLPAIPLFDVVGNADIVAPEQNGPTWVNVGVMFGFTVILLVVIALGQPGVVFETVYVICDVPELTAVIKPVASIVATPGVAEDHVPPLIVELNVVVPGKQITSIPLNAPALTDGQFTAVQLVEPGVKQVPAPPIGVTLIVTASFGVNPFTE